MYGNFAFWVSIATAIVVILIIFKTAVVVPHIVLGERDHCMSRSG